MSHTIVALMQDRPGVLNRVVSLFRRRGYNIASLAVGPSETPDLSRLTMVIDAEDVEQVVKQLYRLIEVVKVTDVTGEATVERETALLKVHVPGPHRAEVVALTTVFGAKVTDAGASTMIVEMTAAPAKLDAFIEVIRPFGIKELMRTGRIAMLRGGPGPGTPIEAADGPPSAGTAIAELSYAKET